MRSAEPSARRGYHAGLSVETLHSQTGDRCRKVCRQCDKQEQRARELQREAQLRGSWVSRNGLAPMNLDSACTAHALLALTTVGAVQVDVCLSSKPAAAQSVNMQCDLQVMES